MKRMKKYRLLVFIIDNIIQYPNLPAFEDCKNNIELLFEEISELSDLEQCQLVNVPETKIRINTQKPCQVQNNPCQVFKTFPKVREKSLVFR